MQSPLPAGSYVISVGAGDIGDQYSWNTINTPSTSSEAIKVSGDQFGTRVMHNTIIGGTFVKPYTSTAIEVEAAKTDPSPGNGISSSYPFPLPYYWTVAPCYGVTVEYNTIENSQGGLYVDIDHGAGVGTSTGRLFLTATVEYNTFEWTQAWLNTWGSSYANGYQADFYGITNPYNNIANAPTDNSRPPSITVGSGFSAENRNPSTVDGPSGTPNGPLGYVDPNELNLTVEGNSAAIIPSTGVLQVRAEPTGQVYDGIINGVVSPTSAYPYNQPVYQIFGNPTFYAP
jgi:hypothetical protein